MKFKNTQPIDVYVDLGVLRRVAPGEVIDLPGALKCEGLAPLYGEVKTQSKATKKATKKAIKKKAPKTAKNVGVSGTI